MKKILQLFIIVTLIVFINKSDLSAKEISGSLSAGEGSSFIPIQGSAFSIIKDIKSGIYDGNFNVLIKSGGRVIYNEKNQLDDLYLVFNESVDNGDIIKLDVTKGLFIFKMSHMNKLPDVIVDAIKEQAPKQYEQMKPLHKTIQKKSIEKNTIAVTEPRVIKRHIEPEAYTPPAPIIPESDIPKLETKETLNKKEAGFFDSISAKFGALIGPDDDKDKIVSSKPIPKDIAKPIANEKIMNPTVAQNRIGNLSKSIDSVNKEVSTVTKRESKLINGSNLEKIAQENRVRNPKTSTSGITSLPIAKTFPLDIDRMKSPVGTQGTLPMAKTFPLDVDRVKKPVVSSSTMTQSPTNIDSFSTNVPPAMRDHQSGNFQTQLPGNTLQKPKFQTNIPKPKVVVKKQKEEKIPEPQLEEIVNIPPVSAPEIIENIEPEVQKPIVVKAPYVKREESKDRIVITKTLAAQKKAEVQKNESRVIKRHVEPEDYKARQKQVPQRMSDRVSRNGYGMGAKGKIKVKAYSNNRPVSAWIEVFKAGTKQRVKTFYTGKGGSLKDINLPAGTYVIKATYRTANSKRKKTIGRVVLEEGGNINKSISFDDGSIRVNVRKFGEPIYAKVEIYKSGSKRRVAYEFTSKSTGVTTLSLGSGKYDIVVKDHNNVRRFDAVSVRGGKRKTVNVDF